jgi:hypothetical protein
MKPSLKPVYPCLALALILIVGGARIHFLLRGESQTVPPFATAALYRNVCYGLGVFFLILSYVLYKRGSRR